MRDIVIRSTRLQYRSPRRVIRDVIAPMGSVTRLHQRLFNKPRTKHIPVTEADDQKQKQPLSAYMIDPKYIASDASLKQASAEADVPMNSETAEQEPVFQQPVLQYSRITHNTADEEAKSWTERFHDMRLSMAAFMALTWERIASSEVALELAPFIERVKDTSAAAAERVAHWYKEHWVYSTPLHYSLQDGQDEHHEVAPVDKSRSAVPFIAVIALACLAVYGWFAFDGLPGINGTDAPGFNGNGTTMGVSDTNEDNGDQPADDPAADESQPGTQEPVQPSDTSADSSPTAVDTQSPPVGGRGGGSTTDGIAPTLPDTGGGSGVDNPDTAPTDPLEPLPEDPVPEVNDDPVLEETDKLLETQLLDTEVTVPEAELKVQDTQILSTPETSIGL